jgi:hypothetical protein
LHIDLNQSEETIKISLYTADGRLVSVAVQENNGHFSIDLDGLARGIYFLDIKAGGTSYREKIIKE